MSSTALDTSIFYQGADFVLPGGTYQFGLDPVTLFTVPLTSPARVESVYMVLQYGQDSAYGDTFVLRLLDVSGAPLWAAPSLEVGTADITSVELTWVRQGIDNAAEGGLIYSWEDGENVYAWWTGRLPELVLRPGSLVSLQAFRGSLEDPVPDLPVTNVAITYTPGSDGGAVTTSDILPLLVPQTA